MNRRTCLQNLSTIAVLPLVSARMMQDKTILKREIPSSGERLPVVGLGTWQTFDVGNSASEQDPLRDVLKVLVENGGSVVDSSPMYGRSEQVVGELSSSIGLNEKLFLATKVWTSGLDDGIRQMNNSLALLQRKKIDLMQIHNLVDWKTHIKTLRVWKEQGKINYIGITHYTESAFPAIEEILKSQTLDFLQINYSMISRKAEERLFPLAQEKKVAILVNQPFEEGTLFRMVKGSQLPSWAEEFDCHSWGQFFLKFILSQRAVTCVIPGTSKPHHMLDNIGAGFGKLPESNHRAQMIKLINSL